MFVVELSSVAIWSQSDVLRIDTRQLVPQSLPKLWCDARSEQRTRLGPCSGARRLGQHDVKEEVILVRGLSRKLAQHNAKVDLLWNLARKLAQLKVEVILVQSLARRRA